MFKDPFTQLLRPFALICLLKLKPQELPPSNFLLSLALGGYAATTTIALLSLGSPLGQAILAGPLAAVIVAALTYSLLLLRNFAERTTQTLTALAGSGCILHLVLLPLALIASPTAEGVVTNGFGGLGLKLLVIWSFVVTAHVLRHSVACPFFVALLLAIVFNVASGELLDLFIDLERPQR